jgi:hypothetical protein
MENGCAKSNNQASPSIPEDLRFRLVDKDAKIQQGDIIENCLRLIPPKSVKIEKDKKIRVKIKAEVCNVIILTQTCDLRDRDLNLVTVAPVYKFLEYIRELKKKRTSDGLPPIKESEIEGYKKNRLKELENNKLERYYYIKGCTLPGFTTDDFIVDLGSVYGLDVDYIESMARKQGNRLTLKDNFKHDLAHKTGNHYSRIDVPKDENDV